MIGVGQEGSLLLSEGTAPGGDAGWRSPETINTCGLCGTVQPCIRDHCSCSKALVNKLYIYTFKYKTCCDESQKPLPVFRGAEESSDR